MEVCLQDTVLGNLGGSAVLPCFSNKKFNQEDITVYWRHNSSMKVFGIIKGKPSVDEQGLEYKNRTQTFPNEYLKGNFSLRLKGLQYNDAGTYVCYITMTNENPSTQLLVKENKERENRGSETSAEKTVPFIILLCILLLYVL